MSKFTHQLYLLVFVGLIAGCGFHLRGIDNELPVKFKQTNLIQGGSSNFVYTQMKRLININGGGIVPADEAKIEVRLSPIRSSSRQVALSGDGSVKEYEKTYILTVTVVDSKTRVQYGQRKIAVTRNLQLDDRKILGGEEQEEVTLRAASKELTQNAVNYLSSFE